MDCPNCGRRNPEDARYCSSCGAALPGADANAPASPQSAHVVTVQYADATGLTEADGVKLLELIQHGIRFDAVKYLRERTGASQGDALNAVNHLAALPRVRPYTVAEIQNAFTLAPVAAPRTMRVGKRGIVAGCLGFVLLGLVCFALMAGASMLLWTVSGAYTQAFERVRASADVREVFGDDIAPVPGFWTGSSSSGATGTSARFQLPVSSSKRSGTMSVSGRTGGSYFGTEWTLSISISYTDDNGQRRTITVR